MNEYVTARLLNQNLNLVGRFIPIPGTYTYIFQSFWGFFSSFGKAFNSEMFSFYFKRYKYWLWTFLHQKNEHKMSKSKNRCSVNPLSPLECSILYRNLYVWINHIYIFLLSKVSSWSFFFNKPKFWSISYMTFS